MPFPPPPSDKREIYENYWIQILNAHYALCEIVNYSKITPNRQRPGNGRIMEVIRLNLFNYGTMNRNKTSVITSMLYLWKILTVVKNEYCKPKQVVKFP